MVPAPADDQLPEAAARRASASPGSATRETFSSIAERSRRWIAGSGRALAPVMKRVDSARPYQGWNASKRKPYGSNASAKRSSVSARPYTSRTLILKYLGLHMTVLENIRII